VLGAPARIDGDELGEIADPVPLDVAPRREPVDADRAVGRVEKAEEQRDEGALPRAVRPGDAEHLAGGDVECDTVHRTHGVAATTEAERPVRLPDGAELDQGPIRGGV
jgi:hypothetical protein